MCLAVPGKIIEIKAKKQAIIDFNGISRNVDLSLIKNPRVGEFVLVHVGFAIQKVDQQAAQETYQIYEEVNKNLLS